MTMHKKYTQFKNKLLIIGFGCIGKGILPLILRHIDMKPEQITILSKDDNNAELAHTYGIEFITQNITRENFENILNQHLTAGDFLLNLSVDVSSAALMQFCQQVDALYLDTCTEPWAGGFVDTERSPSERSNYALREEILTLRSTTKNKSTALLTHGANPGLVSHFVKQALLNIAKDTKVSVQTPTSREAWAALAQQLNIKVIHVAERDTQITPLRKRRDEFVNTWSIDGFISEGSQPAELGWGTHERHWPIDGHHHDFGSQCAIYLARPGAATRVRSWAPNAGPFHAFLITHTETIAISDYFTIKQGDSLQYRPTVHFAYHPCSDAVLSLEEFASNNWEGQSQQRILFDEIVEGMDELGVLLMGHAKGAYWFGSQLSIEQTRALAPYNNATSLQVAVGALAGMVWVMDNPKCGILEPEEIDHEVILKVAAPYLGNMVGEYTDWTPLDGREKLFPETLDKTDPWQFLNMRIS